jgi:hypothetical protein
MAYSFRSSFSHERRRGVARGDKIRAPLGGRLADTFDLYSQLKRAR